jgi:hypothetical protein
MNQKSFLSVGPKYFIPAIIIIALAAGCKMQQIDSVWTSGPIKIDGQRDEWTKMPATYFDDQDVAIGMCNDSVDLYLFFSFKNQMWARAIESTGLTLWLDGTGKKNKKLGIQYKGGPVPEQTRRNNNDESKMPEEFAEKRKEMQEQREANSKKITILNKKGESTDVIPSVGTKGPAVAYGLTNDIYTYEFRLPLAGGLGQYGFGADPGQIVSIGAEWGEMEMGGGDRKRPEGMEGGGMPPGGGGGMPPGGGVGMPPGGGGGMPGGGRPGGGPGGGGQQSEKQELWIKTQLAVPLGTTELSSGSASKE